MLKDIGTHVSAPGRVIFFGDHSINYGGSGIALAVEHRVHCRVKLNSKFSVNGEDLDTNKHPYTRGAVLQTWTNMDKPLAIDFESRIPEGTGLGELAASTIASLGAISMIHNHLIYEDIAKNAFEIHNDMEKGEIPLDISASTHGKGVYLSCHAGKNSLWTFHKENKEWTIHDLDIPEMNLVLGYTGIPAQDTEMQAKILRFYQRNSFARDMITDLCQISTKGHEALVSEDLEETGRLMTQSHKLMMTLGAGHPMLDKLFQAANRHSYGTKLTGYGGGGSIIALTHEPERVISAIQDAGGEAWELELATQGLRLED